MKAKRADFYRVLIALFAAALVAIAFWPEPMLILLSVLVPVTVVSAVLATIYVGRVFRAQPVPRSRFFAMVVELFYALTAVGLWVGYIAVARTVERAGIDVEIPVPPPEITAPISALIVVFVFAAPIRFALEVYYVRKLGREIPEDEDERFDVSGRDDGA